MKKDELPEFPVAKFLQIIGNKWKIYIFKKLFERPHRFNEMKNSIAGISQKLLSENLRQLENYKIISKKICSEKPPQKVEYFLSERGEKIRPLIFEIENFFKNL